MPKLSRPVRIALVALAALVVLAAAAQLVVPGLIEGRIEDRLTEGGGSADASIDAFPAALLLAGDGDSIEVTGSGLELDLDADREPEVFKRLDGFDRVDLDLRDFRAGPFELESFVLTRDGPGPYSLQSSSTTTGAALLQFGASELGVPGSSLIPLITGDEPQANAPIPIELDMELESEGGRILVTEGGGEIAGYPTGPFAELITAAIVVRL
jgi:hypothetical protein